MLALDSTRPIGSCMASRYRPSVLVVRPFDLQEWPARVLDEQRDEDRDARTQEGDQKAQPLHLHSTLPPERGI